MTSLPENCEDWGDEAWLAWLIGTDAAGQAGEGDRRKGLPPPPRRRRLGVELMAAAMIGLEQAISGPREKLTIVVDASGDPPLDDPLSVHIDLEHPEQSVAVVRTWLRPVPPALGTDAARSEKAS